MSTDGSAAKNGHELREPRLWPVPAAIGLGVVLQAASMWAFAENLSYLVFTSLFIIWPLSAFLILLWWILWSNLTWEIRGQGLIGLVVAFLTFVAVFRFDEFDGAMTPKFSFRWKPTATSKAEQFFKERGSRATPVSKNTVDDSAATETASDVVVKTDELNEVNSLVPTDEDNPQYLGRNRDGVVVGPPLRTDWDARPPKKLWRHPIGLGWGSFAAIGRRAWTIEQRGPEELVVCYDIETGEELWQHSDTARFESVQGGNGPRSTPTIHEGQCYALGATGILNCLEAASGNAIWSRNILDDAGSTNLPWGQAGSPLVVDDLVIVAPGSNDDASKSKNSAVIAYRRDTGEKVWSSGNRYGSYAAPHLTTLDGERQVLIFDGVGLSALSVDQGKTLWQFEWSNTPQINASQPLVIDESSVLIGSGYGLGSVLLKVTGAMSNWKVQDVWKSKQFKLKFDSAMRRGDYVYGLDEGLLTCLSLKDGKRVWKQGRYGYGQMLISDDKLLILSEEGDVVIVPASPEPPRELAKFRAIEGKTWNNPVLARGRLLVRNAEEAACYDLK